MPAPGPEADQCLACEPGADVDYELLLRNNTVAPTSNSQVFDFEIVVTLDGTIEIDRIPVRILVPDAPSHEFDAAPGTNFYLNNYDAFDRCNAPVERPTWNTISWEGSTPGDTTIDFQIRAANTRRRAQPRHTGDRHHPARHHRRHHRRRRCAAGSRCSQRASLPAGDRHAQSFGRPLVDPGARRLGARVHLLPQRLIPLVAS